MMPLEATKKKQPFLCVSRFHFWGFCRGVFTLCDRTCGVLANESLAQWYSYRIQGSLQGAFREMEANKGRVREVIREGRQSEVVRQSASFIHAVHTQPQTIDIDRHLETMLNS